MDEMLFISMAKLGADRLREERAGRLFSEPAICSAGGACHVTQDATIREPLHRPTALTALSGSLSIVVVLLIVIAGLSNWYSERIATPAGEVYITELNVDPETSGERVAQSDALSVVEGAEPAAIRR